MNLNNFLQVYENFNFSNAQIEYYLDNNPITLYKLRALNFEIKEVVFTVGTQPLSEYDVVVVTDALHYNVHLPDGCLQNVIKINIRRA